jgi:hypothetical protein
MYDLVLPETARDRYDELLKECEEERRAWQVARFNDEKRIARLLLRLSEWLIDTGVRLRTRVEMRPNLS